jgi:hypothetical protein
MCVVACPSRHGVAGLKSGEEEAMPTTVCVVPAIRYNGPPKSPVDFTRKKGVKFIGIDEF